MANWRSSASLHALQARASLYAVIRQFFSERNVLEVDTPALAQHGVTDLHIDCIEVPNYGYLQSSPEFHMKRLLAAGSGPIYQIGKAFRDGERGTKHNPEFTMLEWYRPGFSLQDLIDECIVLLRQCLSINQTAQYHFRELFFNVVGLDPLSSDIASLRQAALAYDSHLPELEKPALIDWFMSCVVEPALPQHCINIVTDFPEWAAALAKKRTDARGDIVAERFEIYVNGIELANGYLELTDAQEQASRFANDNALRQQQNKKHMTPDQALINALKHGLPHCSGVAIGLDRVLLVQQQAQSLADIIAFPHDRA